MSKALNFTLRDAGSVAPAIGNRPILYAHTLCPYAARVWLTMLEKGVPFDLIHVDLSHKPTWFSSITRRGLVPALQHGGKVHLESLDICNYIDAAIPGPPLSINDISTQLNVIAAGCDLSEAGLRLLAGTACRSWGIGSGNRTTSQRAAFRTALSNAIVDPLQRFGGPYLLGCPRRL